MRCRDADSVAGANAFTLRGILRHDYHPRDFAIYLYKAART